jgi:putative tryptophan/tyrosine transport system substrate-binding protein
MRRRDFVNLLGSVAAAWPLTVRAQEPYRMRRVGMLLGNSEDREAQPFIAAFREELVKLGWTEGRNVQIDIRSAPADVASMRRFAKELAALQPDLIVTESTPAAGAMLEETRTIPVVFTLVADPVGSGFVASLSRPGGNATGFTPIVSSLGGKWVELLKEIAPHR